MVGRDTKVPTTEGPRRFIDLDNGASTPTFRPVWETVRRTWKLPESERRLLVAEVKEICARFMNMSSDRYDLIFTSNTTEAINLVAGGLALERDPDSEPVVLNSLLEHNSNELPWRSVGGIDRTLRIMIGSMLVLAGIFLVKSQALFIIFGLALLTIGLVGFCPAYVPFGISTRKRE